MRIERVGTGLWVSYKPQCTNVYIILSSDLNVPVHWVEVFCESWDRLGLNFDLRVMQISKPVSGCCSSEWLQIYADIQPCPAAPVFLEKDDLDDWEPSPKPVLMIKLCHLIKWHSPDLCYEVVNQKCIIECMYESKSDRSYLSLLVELHWCTCFNPLQMVVTSQCMSNANIHQCRSGKWTVLI